MLERIVSAVTYGMNPKKCFQEVQLRNCWRRDGAMSRPASRASERSSIVGSSLTTRSRQRTGLQIYLSLAVLDTREVKGRRKRSLLLFTLCPHSALARYSPYRGACRTVCKAYSQAVIGDGLCRPFSLPSLFLLHPPKICSPFCQHVLQREEVMSRGDCTTARSRAQLGRPSHLTKYLYLVVTI